MVRHTQTICQVLPTNCLIVPDHFVGLALKRLKIQVKAFILSWKISYTHECMLFFYFFAVIFFIYIFFFCFFLSDEFGIEVGSETRTQSILKEKTGMESLLSLDGGGIRGLVLAELLLALESITKRPIYDLFDWSSGTSTGSYLAVSVANRKLLYSNSYFK